MFGVTLAAIVFSVFFASHIAYSHLFTVEKKERALICFMGAAGVTYVLALQAAPSWALAELRVVPWSADRVSGLATLGFLVLGYIEFWSLVERSFSLRILIDTSARGSGLTRDEIAKHYSEGRGLDWMMEKRIKDLLGSGMLEAAGRTATLSRRGRVVARVFRVLGRIFSIA
jgi:hypothetical protein